MITLNQLKQFLKIDLAAASQDTLLADFRSRAISEFNTMCNRSFEYGTCIEDIIGNGNDSVYLPNYPVHSITAIEVYNKNGDYTYVTLFDGSDTAANSTVINSEIGELIVTKGYAFTSDQKIKVTYTAGYVSGDDWITNHGYVSNDYVRFNNRVYKCKTSHTSGTFTDDLNAGKWELALETLAPEDIQNAVLYLAAKFYYESPAGKNYFMKQTDTRTKPDVTETTNLKEIDLAEIANAHRNINI